MSGRVLDEEIPYRYEYCCPMLKTSAPFIPTDCTKWILDHYSYQLLPCPPVQYEYELQPRMSMLYSQGYGTVRVLVLIVVRIRTGGRLFISRTRTSIPYAVHVQNIKYEWFSTFCPELSRTCSGSHNVVVLYE